MKLNMIAHIVTLSFVLILGVYLMVQERFGFGVKVYALFASVLALYLLLQRDLYLPFLGRAAFPMGLVQNEEAPKGANVSHELEFDAKDEGKRVIYWGAKPSQQVIPNPWDAYQDFSNAGVAVIKNGKAIVKFFCPTAYKVPWGKTLNRHIHYRVCCDRGLMGPVETAFIKC